MKVIVIGAGASGLVSAIKAREAGHDVTVLEKNNNIGEKILMTGNGRCNMSNINLSSEFYFDDSMFAESIISKFDINNFKEFFERIGIITTDRNAYIYPSSMQASSVVKALVNFAQNLGVKLKTNNEVLNLEKNENGFVVDTGYKYECDKVIIAVGGLSYTDRNAVENICASLKNMGVKFATKKPALTALISNSVITKASGVRVDCNVSGEKNTKTFSDFGQVQITDYGISGIPVFNISRFVDAGDVVTIDFAPKNDENDLIDKFTNILNSNNEIKIKQLLNSFLNDKISDVIIEVSDFKNDKVTKEIIESVVSLIKKFDVKIDSRRGFDYAQVTQGGVITEEIDINTMQDKNIEGLYYCGEVIDIDGNCGGYNLHFAWATGYIAGSNV